MAAKDKAADVKRYHSLDKHQTFLCYRDGKRGVTTYINLAACRLIEHHETGSDGARYLLYPDGGHASYTFTRAAHKPYYQIIRHFLSSRNGQYW